MTSHPTLDQERTDQLRTFLTVEAAADAVAHAPGRPRAHGGRRLLAGGVAAVVLAGVALLATSIGGGPGTPTATRAEAAVAIEVDDGWTTVRLADIDADPDQVVAELRAAGIVAHRERLQGISVDEVTGEVLLESAGAEPIETGPSRMTVIGASTVGADGAVPPGTRGLAGISVKVPDHIAIPPDGPEAQMDPESAFHQDMADFGVRLGDDGSVSVRNGSAAEIVVLTAK